MEFIRDIKYVSLGEPVKCNMWDSPLFQTTEEEDRYVTSVVDQLFPEQGKERIRAMMLIDRLYYEAKLKCQQQILMAFRERSTK
jgi:hypothetical protein